MHLRHRDRLRSSDAYLLYRRTHIPSPVWLAVFAVIISGCLLAAFSAYALR